MNEFSVALYAKFKNKKERDAIAFLLDKKTRPDFDDEVDEWMRLMFYVIDDMDYPSISQADEDIGLSVIWWEGKSSPAELLRAIKKLGGQHIVGYFHGLEYDSGNVELDNGFLFLHTKGGMYIPKGEVKDLNKALVNPEENHYNDIQDALLATMPKLSNRWKEGQVTANNSIDEHIL